MQIWLGSRRGGQAYDEPARMLLALISSRCDNSRIGVQSALGLCHSRSVKEDPP